jgi:hypothetical protein
MEQYVGVVPQALSGLLFARHARAKHPWYIIGILSKHTIQNDAGGSELLN